MANLAVIVTKFGAPLELKETPIPTPGKDEAVIKIKLAPINPADNYSVLGYYPGWQPASLPATPGLEGYGVVHAVGEGVENLKVGDRVAPVLSDSPRSWQQYVLIKKNWAVKIPDNISDEVAAQLVINPPTAWGMLEQLNLQKGQYLLQSAAGSEVGRMVIQAAKFRGIKTVNLVRRKDQIEELKSLGADIVLWSEEEGNLTEKIKKETGGGVHGAIDCVLGDLHPKMSAALLSGGKIVIYGALAGPTFTSNGMDHLFRGIKTEGFWVSPLLIQMVNARDGKMEKMFEEIFSWIEADPTFGTHIGERFELKQINEAVQAALKPAKPGKVLISN